MVLFRSYRNPINAAAVVTRPTTTTEEMKNIDLHGVAAVPVDWRQADSIHSYWDSQQHDRDVDDDVTHDVTSRQCSAAIVSATHHSSVVCLSVVTH